MGFVMIQLFHLFKALFDSSGAEMRCQITVKSLLTHLKIPIWLKRLGSIYKPLLAVYSTLEAKVAGSGFLSIMPCFDSLQSTGW